MPSKEHLVMPRDVLGYYNRGVGGAAGVWWVEARDIDASYNAQGSPDNKELSVPKCR